MNEEIAMANISLLVSYIITQVVAIIITAVYSELPLWVVVVPLTCAVLGFAATYIIWRIAKRKRNNLNSKEN